MAPLVLDHLWQSTLVALALGLLALGFRRASASVRYGLWFAASVKFLVPFAALTALGRLLGPAIPLPVQAKPEAAFIAQAVQPFSQPAPSQDPLSAVPFAHGADLQAPLAQVPVAHADAAAAVIHAASHLDLGLILLAVWGLGSAAMLVVWAHRWARIRRIVRSARRLDWTAPMPVLAAPSLVEPGLVGLWRPVLLVPETLSQRLSRPAIDALLAHEACHLRRRDNLCAALHMLVEALFWFHPLVWWIGARLIEQRERACDEAVVQAGHDRAAYARSLVEICRLYLQSPLDCMAGASGSDLKMRVGAIMTARPTSPPSRAGKALLLAAGACAIATPVAAGLLTTPEARKAVARAAALAIPAVPVRVAPANGQAVETGPAPDDGETAKPVILARTDRIVAPGLSIARLDPVAGPRLAQDLAPAAAARLALAPAAAASRSPDPKPELAAFVKSYGDAFWNTDSPICIRVEGLASDKEAAVKARVEADARAAGVGVGRAECGRRYQVEIRFAADAERAVGDVLNYHRHPIWPFPLDRPQGADRPIKAWYGMTYDFAGAPPGQRNLGAYPSARRKLALAIVVVDPARTQGLSLDVVSDYVALLALSQPRTLDRCNVLPSVTDLFAGACPGRSAPAGLTAADAAYLKALYTGSAGIRATRSPAELVEGMAKRLGAAAPQAAAR
jgi:beta-lactamase regulating signal transducer with metallopeptidase domain